jgi:hypothetical protein
VILGAALLVLLGLGLFVAGILTGVTLLYWGCVAVCVVAAVLLFAVRRQLGRQTGTATTEATATTTTTATTAPEPAGATAKEPAPAADSPPAPGERAGGHPADGAAVRPARDLPDPAVEEVEVTDLLIVVDLKDEVLVVDEHPRYHLSGCRWLSGRETIPLPIDEARADGFTPCAMCAPDRNLAERARARKRAGG